MAHLERTLAGQAVAAIQQRIISGEYEPGRHLRIEELADNLDMSPMPVREALQRLDMLGFVDQQPHRGATVTAMSLDDVLDTYSVRIPLEMLAVRRAARRFSAAAAEAARRWLDEYLEYDVRAIEARDANANFHFAIYQASASRWLVRTIRPLYDNSERYRMAALDSGGDDAHWRERHEELLRACVERDENWAAEQLQAMLMTTVKAIEEKINGHSGDFELEPIRLSAFLPVE